MKKIFYKANNNNEITHHSDDVRIPRIAQFLNSSVGDSLVNLVAVHCIIVVSVCQGYVLVIIAVGNPKVGLWWVWSYIF